MASYNVFFRKSASRQLRKLPPGIAKRIVPHVDELENEPFPHGVEQLKGIRKPTLYRLRVGDYRILYTVEASEKTVTIFAVQHRRDVYRK